MLRQVLFLDRRVSSGISGSSLIRSHQLQRLTKEAFAENGLRTGLSETLDHSGAVLILNKNALMRTGLSALEKAAASNRLVADPLDGLVEDDKLFHCHAILAASRMQLEDLRRRFPAKPVSYVGHHIDLRIPDIYPPRDRMRMGYFGEIVNAAHADSLGDLVTMNRVNTSTAEQADWIGQLAGYNAHYALRADRPIDGFKPFTKGFIAAHCGSAILAANDDAEAAAILGADYPFFCDRSDANQVRDFIGSMADGFGNAEWRSALAILAAVREQESRENVRTQLLRAILPLAGRNAKV